MDNANASDFEQDFWKTVGQQDGNNGNTGNGDIIIGDDVEKKPSSAKKALVIGGIVLAMISISAVAAVMISRKSGKKGDEELLAVSEDERDASEDDGSWKLYNDDGSVVIAVRMTCSSDQDTYKFYKDNSYSIYNSEGFLADDGTYSLGQGVINLNGEKWGESQIRYDFGDFMIGDEQFTCRKYNDA